MADPVVVQLVMKREDGRSVLDLPPADECDDPSAFDVTEARAAEIRARLERLGMKVVSGNLNTLSVEASARLLADHFGLAAEAAEAGTAAHATRIAPELAPFVADVFITPGPEFFP